MRKLPGTTYISENILFQTINLEGINRVPDLCPQFLWKCIRDTKQYQAISLTLLKTRL